MADRRKLSANTKEEIYSTFKEYDQDGNGVITLLEAQEVLKSKLGFDKQQTAKLVNMCDTNKDGKLSYEEFVDFYFRVREKVTDLQATFLEFDQNKDGFVSIEEAKEAMHNMGVFNDDEIEALVDAYDVNHDGRLQYDEFVKFWNAK